MACLLPLLPLRVIVAAVLKLPPFQIETQRPGPGVDRRVVENGLVPRLVGVKEAIALDDMDLVAREITCSAETALGVAVGHIHDERIRLPAAAWGPPSQPDVGSCVWTSVQGNDSIGVTSFVLENDVAVIL